MKNDMVNSAERQDAYEVALRAVDFVGRAVSAPNMLPDEPLQDGPVHVARKIADYIARNPSREYILANRGLVVKMAMRVQLQRGA